MYFLIKMKAKIQKVDESWIAQGPVALFNKNILYDATSQLMLILILILLLLYILLLHLCIMAVCAVKATNWWLRSHICNTGSIEIFLEV